MYIADATSGQWINENYERLARILKDYCPTLELRWIPPDRRTRDDKAPYQVVNVESNGQTTLVCYGAETETPETILGKVIWADQEQGSTISRLDAHNAAVELMRAKKHLDELEELSDLAAFMKFTPLHYIKMGRDEEGKQIKLDDTRRRI